MSTPCGHKKNTETVAQYRKRCGGRPLGMIMKMGEGDDKVELIKLYNKALKMMPGSANQKKIKKQISVLRKKLKMDEAPRKPRKKGQPAGSKKHSDLYTDENPKGTIHGLKFATVKDAQKSVSKIKGSGKTHAHKIQAAIAMEQRAKAAGKKSAAGVYRKFINQMKKKTKQRNEGWSDKYKKSIDCNNPKGFSQKAHCAGRKKRENKMSLKLEQLVGKFITEEQFDEAAGKKDACYYKVKARYDVWPSAYASGALVKCRKVGAKNWGNKSKKESYDIFSEDGKWGYTMTGLVEAEYQGRKVKLGKPMQGDSKKFKVYVKNDKGNVVKVNFGHGGSSAKGKTMRIRKSNPEARKSFRARHNCDNPGPRWKARYWSCKKW